MKKYKALMLDLDGTTIPNRRDGMPSEKIVDAIEKAKKVIQVSIVTSRLFRDALPLIKILKLSSPCIVDGGALIFDPLSSKILWEQPMERADAKLLWKF